MSSWRSRIAAWIAGPQQGRRGVRMYSAARGSRIGAWLGASSTSADAELHTSLTALRSRSRAMIRDAAYARRAKTVIVNNVIGVGVGMQAQVMTTRDALATRVNDGIESSWREWARAENCHTGGALAFGDLEQALVGEVFEAGEVLVRLHRTRFGGSRVPLALELIEAERLAGDIQPPATGEVRMGVEVDQFQRPVAYWIRERHTGDIASLVRGGERIERVPAEDIIHLKRVTRWPMTRGEPWMAAALRKVDDLSEYSQHEITAARASAAYFATIETPEADQNPLVSAVEDDGQQVMDIDPLTIQALAPGEKLEFHTPNRPNSAFAEFVRSMLREIAAGVGVSYESLSRDYSQSNYSSSRLALLDDRDTYRALQQWWIRAFREPLHRLWLQQAALANAIAELPVEAYATGRARYEAVLFKPRGWSWVDPTKEVNAYKEAIKAGLTTLTDVIAATAGGLDIEDVIATRKRELEMLREAGILTDTEVLPEPAPVAPPEPQDEDTEEDDTEDRPAGNADKADERPDRARTIKRVA